MPSPSTSSSCSATTRWSTARGRSSTRCPATTGRSSPTCGCSCACMWAHPGKKLLFQGGEFGQWSEWKYDRSLDWHLTQYPQHDGLRRYGPAPQPPLHGTSRRSTNSTTPPTASSGSTSATRTTACSPSRASRAAATCSCSSSTPRPWCARAIAPARRASRLLPGNPQHRRANLRRQQRRATAGGMDAEAISHGRAGSSRSTCACRP